MGLSVAMFALSLLLNARERRISALAGEPWPGSGSAAPAISNRVGEDCLEGGKMQVFRLPARHPDRWFQLAAMPPEPAATAAVVTWVSDPSAPTR